jgi:hypothetical protein
VIHVTIKETGDKQALNTPGGDEFMKRLGGPAGLPFFAFLDTQGAVIVNSLLPREIGGANSGNIGHPFKPYEVDWFLTMLDRGAPRMLAEERSTLEKLLRAQPK